MVLTYSMLLSLLSSNQMEQLPTDKIEKCIKDGLSKSSIAEYNEAFDQLSNILSALKEAQDDLTEAYDELNKVNTKGAEKDAEIERLKLDGLKHIDGLKDIIVAKDAEIVEIKEQRDKMVIGHNMMIETKNAELGEANDIRQEMSKQRLRFVDRINELEAELAAAKEQEKQVDRRRYNSIVSDIRNTRESAREDMQHEDNMIMDWMANARSSAPSLGGEETRSKLETKCKISGQVLRYK